MAAFAVGLPGERFGDDVHLLLGRLGPLGLTDVPALLTQNWWGELVAGRHYRPLALAVLGLERVAFGTHALPYHVVGLALHAAASVLCWRLLQRLGFGAAALAAGLLFAVHPIHAEAVLAAYGQADLLVALFMLGALERYAAFAETGSRRTLAASYALFFLALGCKETAAVLPALVVLTRGLLLRPDAPGLRRWITGVELGYAAPFALYLGLRSLVLGRLLPPSEVTVSHGFPFWLRVKTVLLAVAHDVRLSVVPTGQSIDHRPLNGRLAGSAVVEAAWLAASFVVLALVSRAAPRSQVAWVAFAVGWFVVCVAPVAGIVPIPVLVSERNLYLPALAPAILAAVLLGALRRRALARGALALLVALGIGASTRVAWAWRTPETLWEAVVAHDPGEVFAWIWLGGARFTRAGVPLEASSTSGVEDPAALARAREAYDRALALDPERPEARVGRAAVAFVDRDCTRALGLLAGIEPEAFRPAAGPRGLVSSPWFREQTRRCSPAP